MGIVLKKHNIEAYAKIIEAFKRGNRVGIIHPTGTGKSFLALKLIEDNKSKKVLYLAPSNAILHSLKRNIFHSGMTMADFTNLKRMTYQKLIKLSDEEISKLKPDIIILDEFHHCGAPEWGKGISRLLELNPDVQILGLSATPIRYFDFGRDMAEELFEDNIASEMSLEDAIEKGILPRAKYVATVYRFEKELEQMKSDIDKMTNPEDKEMAEKLFVKLSKDISKNTENLPTILAKHMEIKNGKYIVFCKNIEDMNEKVRQAQDIFGEVNPNIKTYMVSSKLSDNEKTLKAFEDDKDDKSLKLMFAVDMLNEGYHISDLDGVIMMRPTYSPTIYAQQLGRALTVKEDPDKEPLIIDLVNNFDYIKIIEDLYERLKKYNKIGEQKKEDPQSWLKIDDRLKEFMQVAEKISQLSKRRKISLEEKIEIFERYFKDGNDEIDGLTTFEGKPIGQWAISIRSAIKNGYDSVRPTPEQLKKLEGFGILESRIDSTIDEKIDQVIDWYERYPYVLIESKKTNKEISFKIIRQLSDISNSKGIDYAELEQEYRKMQNYMDYIKTRDFKGKLTEEQRLRCKEGNLRGRFGVPTRIENLAEKFKIDIKQVSKLIANYGSIENFLQSYKEGKLSETDFSEYNKSLTNNVIDMDYDNPLSDNYIRLIREIFRIDDNRVFLISSKRIEDELKKLPEDETTALNLYYGLSDGQTNSLRNISSQLNCTVQAVKRKIQKGSTHLRSALYRGNIGFYDTKKIQEHEFFSEEDMAIINEFEDEFWNSNIIFQHESAEDINFDKRKFALITNLVKKLNEAQKEAERIAVQELEENIAKGSFKSVGIESMDFSARAYNVLKRAGIKTLEDLKNTPLEKFNKIRNLGRKTHVEILSKAEKYGITLKTEEELKLEDVSRDQPDEEKTVNTLDFISLEDLNLGIRSYNTLKRAGINTLGDISRLTRERLSQVRNMSVRSLKEIFELLEKHGVVLKTEEELKIEKQLRESGNLDSLKIEEISLGIRSYNVLKRAGINTIGDLSEMTLENLSGVRNMGRNSYKEILDKLGKYGITLRSEEDLTIDNATNDQTELESLRKKKEELKGKLQDVDEQINQAEKLLTDYTQLAGDDRDVQEDDTLDIEDK